MSGLLAGGLLAGVAPVVAVADPGSCLPGDLPDSVLIAAQVNDGPVAGPASTTDWDVAEGAPNAPGQALKNLCGPGETP